MLVEVYDFGRSTDDYYVVYRVKELSEEEQKKLKSVIEGTAEIKDGYLFITNNFEEKYFPFGSQAAKMRPDDFISREEIEMTVYLTSLLED